MALARFPSPFQLSPLVCKSVGRLLELPSQLGAHYCRAQETQESAQCDWLVCSAGAEAKGQGQVTLVLMLQAPVKVFLELRQYRYDCATLHI